MNHFADLRSFSKTAFLGSTFLASISGNVHPIVPKVIWTALPGQRPKMAPSFGILKRAKWSSGSMR